MADTNRCVQDGARREMFIESTAEAARYIERACGEEHMPGIAHNQTDHPTAEWKDKLRGLLDRLDADSRPPGSEVRRAQRIRYRSLDVVVEVLDRHQSTTCSFGVVTRNISATGLAFLHKQMLPSGLNLRVEIPVLDEQVLHVLACVRRCRHVAGMIHEVGVEFLSPIDEN